MSTYPVAHDELTFGNFNPNSLMPTRAANYIFGANLSFFMSFQGIHFCFSQGLFLLFGGSIYVNLVEKLKQCKPPEHSQGKLCNFWAT